MANGLFDNHIIQGTAYLADAYATIVLQQDFSAAYLMVLKAITAFGGTPVIKQLVVDLEAFRPKGDPAHPHVE